MKIVSGSIFAMNLRKPTTIQMSSTTSFLTLFLILFSNLLIGQDKGEYSHSIVKPSPNGDKVIVGDVYVGEVTYGPQTTFLYSLPLNMENRIQLKSDPNYKWSTHGRYFFTEEPGGDFGGVLQSSRILVFNSEGDSLRTIENGVAIDPDLTYFLRDTDKNGKQIAPRLMRYNLEKDVSKEVIVFPDSLTLWALGDPCIAFSPRYPVDLCGGKMVVLFQRRGKDDTRGRKAYTFLIFKGEILMTEKGIQTDSHSFKAKACKMMHDRQYGIH